jgi:hypothetical protein
MLPLLVSFVLYAAVVIVVDNIIMDGYRNSASIPQTIETQTAKQMLQSLIQVDGILLGFIGGGYAAILSRGHEQSGWVRLFQSLPFLVSAIFLLMAVNYSYVGLASNSGFGSTDFGTLLALSFNGVLVLILGVVLFDEIATTAKSALK